MTADIRITRELEITGIRVRRGWRGKLVLQIQRRLETVPLFVGKPKPAGFGKWRDSDGNNPTEVAQVIELMKRIRT